MKIKVVKREDDKYDVYEVCSSEDILLFSTKCADNVLLKLECLIDNFNLEFIDDRI